MGEPVSTPLIRLDSLYLIRKLTIPDNLSGMDDSPTPAKLAGVGGSYGALSSPAQPR